MNKRISSFRTEPYGYFIDLADGGVTAVGPHDGQILLDEGDGPDCFYGAFINAKDVRGISVAPRAGGTFEVILRYGLTDEHSLGTTTDGKGATAWVAAVQKVFSRNRKSSSFEPAGTDRAD